jgi:hypothetical protein
MQRITVITLGVIASVAAGATAFADVRLSIQDGRVSIVASDATVTEILSEWAKVGQTTVVNADRIPPERVTIELQNVSEERALEVLLRHSSGYIAAPRASERADASLFDRIVIMPPSAPPVITSLAAATSRVSAPQPTELADDVDEPAVASASAPAAPIGAAPATYSAGTGGSGGYGAAQSAAPMTGAPPPAAEPVAANAPFEDANSIGTEAGAVEPPSADAQAAIPARRALETADPREFQALMRRRRNTPAVPSFGTPQPGAGTPVPGTVQPPRRPGGPS